MRKVGTSLMRPNANIRTAYRIAHSATGRYVGGYSSGKLGSPSAVTILSRKLERHLGQAYHGPKSNFPGRPKRLDF
jgi:hypothetical protein